MFQDVNLGKEAFFFLTKHNLHKVCFLSSICDISPASVCTFNVSLYFLRDSQVVVVLLRTHLPMQETKDSDSVPGSRRSPGGGDGNPLQHSCLENFMGRGAWRATVHEVAKSRTQLKQLSMHEPQPQSLVPLAGQHRRISGPSVGKKTIDSWRCL